MYVFFFKQKTAYEMRISDWSSDVCSSDLSKGRPFVLAAGSAVQRSSAEPIVQLDDLAAGIQLSDGPAKIAAPGGRYNMDSEKVALDGPITVRTASGYALDTKDATVDLQARTMASDGGVSGTPPQGTFRAHSMSANPENRTVSPLGRAQCRERRGKY